MLLCFLYGMGSISESEMADGHDPSVYQAKQKGFLEQYQTFELHELQRVVSFLKHLAFIGNFHDQDGLVVFSGPRFILQVYKYRNPVENIRKYFKHRRPSEGFFKLPWLQVMSDRGESTWTARTILEGVYGADDICRSISTRNLMQPLLFIPRHQ